MTTRRTKAGADEAAKPPQEARQAAKGAKAGKGGPGCKRASRRPPGQAKAPGCIVAIGVDVPSLDELAAEAEAAKRVEDEVKREGPGHPTDYHPRYAEIARAMCKLGASDFDLAEEFGVTTQTIWRWRAKHARFCYALLEGKDAFDNRIERSLAMRAAGYSVHTEKVFNYEGSIIRAGVVEHYPPDVGAIKMWLGNRRPDKWKDKAEVKLDGSDAFLKIWQAISEGRA